MKKVCLFHFPPMADFHGYSIDYLDPLPYFRGSSWFQRWASFKLYHSKWVDQMYRDKDSAYMRFVKDFVEKYRDADLIILANYNPVHPEILDRYLDKPIKILGFVDDPLSTYLRGIQYLWAFDGAFYVSPSYNHRLLFNEALEQWGCRQTRWFPLVPPSPSEVSRGPESLWPLAVPRMEFDQRGDDFFVQRDLDLIYVGKQYGPKINRLIQLRKHFGSRMTIRGRWSLAGYGGMVRGLLGKPIFWGKVRPIAEETKRALYYRSKIGFNMHFSDMTTETGNLRMYEIPAHGMMLLCDKAGLNAHEKIFVQDKEAVFYDSIEDAIEKAEYYLKHDEERACIAKAGFMRVQRDYDGESNLKALLDWGMSLPRRSRRPIPALHFPVPQAATPLLIK